MFSVFYFPDFHLQVALRLEPELWKRPVALLSGEAAGGVVFQLTDPARAADVFAGMTSTQAMARCEGTIFKDRSLVEEVTAGEALLQVACSFAPGAEVTAEGVYTIDLRGQSAGEESWARKVIETFSRIGFRAQVGVGENPSLALHAARCARPYLAVANSTAFLAALPIENIEPSPEILGILAKWGIRTLGEFTLLGREAIAERLCREGLELFERASIGAGRPLRLSTPPEIFEEVKEFDQEIESLEPLLFILRRFVDQLAPRLELVGMVAAELGLRLRLASGEFHQRQLKIPAPTREASVLFRVLHTYLETVHTDQPVVAVSLRAIPTRETGQQFRLFEIALRDPNQFFETLARLVALVGSDRVGTPIMESTHRPDAFRLQPITWDAPHRTRDTARLAPKPSLVSGLVLRRFRPPIQALVNFQEGRPRAVRSSHFSDGLEQAEGPWRSSGDWWDEQPWARDEWDVRTCRGELYRLHCERDCWFIDGVYD